MTAADLSYPMLLALADGTGEWQHLRRHRHGTLAALERRGLVEIRYSQTWLFPEYRLTEAGAEEAARR